MELVVAGAPEQHYSSLVTHIDPVKKHSHLDPSTHWIKTSANGARMNFYIFLIEVDYLQYIVISKTDWGRPTQDYRMSAWGGAAGERRIQRWGR